MPAPNSESRKRKERLGTYGHVRPASKEARICDHPTCLSDEHADQCPDC